MAGSKRRQTRKHTWVEKLKSGNYRGVARDRITGKRYSKTFPSRREALAWAIQYRDQLRADYLIEGIDILNRPSCRKRIAPDPNDPAYDFIVERLCQLAEYGFDREDPNTVRFAINRGRSLHRSALLVEQRQAAKSGQLVRLLPGQVVYYARVGSRCKIGYTANLPRRMASISPDELLATEPGNLATESGRHDEFQQLRIEGEWYRLEAPLTDWIAKLRASG